MILTLDNLASRYHILPSEAARNADTFDIYVMDLSSKWNKKQTDKANGVDSTPNYSVDELAAILENQDDNSNI